MSEKQLEAEACAMRLLARRDHSSGELRTKLLARHFDADLVDHVIATMIRDGWLNDAKFAANQAEILARKGWGPIQIRGKLRQHGVEGDLAADTVDGLEIDWLQAANARLQAKFGTPVANDTRERAYRHLTYRGFPPELARRAVFDG